MSSLYKDAIADARKLREAAEQNAKNRIIDAVTPKLRRLIERQILEGDEFVDSSAIDDLVDTEDAMDMMDDVEDSVPEAEPMDMSAPSMDTDTDGLGSIEVVPDELESDMDGFDGTEDSSADDLEGVDAEIEDESQNKSVHVNITVEGRRNYLLRHRAIRLVKALSEAKTRKQRQKIRKELGVLRSALIITENSQNLRLAKNIKVILKESTMRRRNRNWLFEGKDGMGGEEVEFDDAGFEEGDVDVDAIKDAVADLASAVGMDVEEGGDEDLDLDDEDMDDEDMDLDMEDDEDLDLEEYDEMMEDDEMYESDEMDQCETDELTEADEDEVVEVNEAMLRRALGASRRRRSPRRTSRRISESRRRQIARARRRRMLREGEAKAMASHFGGGKLGKEMFVDVDENTLLNALAEELGGSVANSTKASGSASKMASHFGGGSIKKSKALKESRRRTLRAQRQAKAAKAELKESNLFNAKLLYVTKLMQQHTLNNKQQRAIIEAMDNAKTQREAKLLFTSLNESLNKRTAQKLTEARKTQARRLNENRSRTGTTSRSLRSGQAPRNNGVELDRWAVLAGIKK